MTNLFIVVENREINRGYNKEIVSLKGVYINKEEAEARLEALNNTIDNKGFLKESDLNDRYLFKMMEVEAGKDINEYL